MRYHDYFVNQEMRRPERLWDQYSGKAKAESIRGSGVWPLQPHTCELEPPWDAFDHRKLNLWDCMINGWEAPWEGSWFARTFSSNTSLDDCIRISNQPLQERSLSELAIRNGMP
jgi:hypothetical protein